MINLFTKFEVFSFTCSKERTGIPKLKESRDSGHALLGRDLPSVGYYLSWSVCAPNMKCLAAVIHSRNIETVPKFKGGHMTP